MRNKARPRLCLAALALVLAAPLAGELLHLELLARKRPPFRLRRDIFLDAGAAAPAAAPTAVQAQEQLQRSIAEEIAQSVTYEGFILKDSRPLALLNVSGDFLTAGEGETLLDKIRILKITRETVTIEYDGQPYEIRIKGDANG